MYSAAVAMYNGYWSGDDMSLLSPKGGDGNAQPPITLEGVMAEVNKTIDAKLGARFDDFKKTGLGDAIKAQVDPVTSQLATINEALGKLVSAQVIPDSGGIGSGAKPPVPPEVNAQLRTMGDQLKSYGNEITQLKTAKENAEKRAEETERHSVIRGALGGLPFVNERAAETAFTIIQPHVRRLEDGALVADVNGESFPVEAFTKDYLTKEHGYLFRTSGSSGSGAPPVGGSLRMGAKVDTSIIKANMKPEDRAAVVESIAAALQGVA